MSLMAILDVPFVQFLQLPSLSVKRLTNQYHLYVPHVQTNAICPKNKVTRFVQHIIMRDSSLKHSGMARVNEGSHSFTCHPHVYPQVERAIPAFAPQPHSVTALWPVLIFHPAEGRRLSWP